MIFAAASLPAPPALCIASMADLPRQPLRLFRLVKKHAVKLFNCEDSRYPQAGQTSSRRNTLAARVEGLIREDILRFEEERSLRFHATVDEMMSPVRQGLADHIDNIPKLSEPPTDLKLPIEPDRRALVDSYIQAEFLRTGKPVTRAQIWQKAGYTSPTDFERWQRKDPLTSKSADRNFARLFAATVPAKACARELTPLPDTPAERHAHRVILHVSGRRFEITLHAETREITRGPAKIIEMPGRSAL